MHEATTDERTSASQAFDRALARCVSLWRERPHRPDGLSEPSRIECLAEQLRRLAGGERPPVQAAFHGPVAHAFIASVRRSLLEEAKGAEGSICVGELASILLTLDRATEDIAASAANQFSDKLSHSDGSDLVVEVAHDMRSPLTSILFLVETIRKGHSGPINAVQERQLALVYSAAFGLSSIASDVIELAQGGDRLMERTPIRFSVAELFQSVYDILQPMAEEKGLIIRLIPPPANFRIGYPSALTRVLLNLATNAVKFTSRGFVELAATQRSGTRVAFSVRDTGPGIPSEVMGQLFEPFRQHETGGKMFSSAGLGLAICSRLVSRMDGELRVESARDAGTRFSFELDLPLESRV